MTYRKAPWDALKFQADITSRFGFLLHSSEWHKWRNYKQWLYFKNFLWWNWYWLWYWLQRLSRNSYNGAQWILTSRKLPPMKIPSYESFPLWKLPSRKLPQKINPKKIVPYESCHHSREKLKVVTMQSICSHEK